MQNARHFLERWNTVSRDFRNRLNAALASGHLTYTAAKEAYIKCVTDVFGEDDAKEITRSFPLKKVAMKRPYGPWIALLPILAGFTFFWVEWLFHWPTWALYTFTAVPMVAVWALIRRYFLRCNARAAYECLETYMEQIELIRLEIFDTLMAKASEKQSQD